MPELLFSRRRMLNRLSPLESRPLHALIDQQTGQAREGAVRCLRHLEQMGFADEHPDGWRMSDEGIVAAARNGVIYAEDAGR